MRRSKVLIVDDEESIIMGLARVLYQDNTQYDVLVSFSAEVARDILADSTVDVLVTDIHLPGRDGVDLLAWTADHSPETRVFVMTAYDTHDLQDKVYRLGCLDIVEKPFDLHEMRRRVLEALEQPPALRGQLEALAPADIVQMLCLNQRSLMVRVVDGRNSSVVHIDKGEIVHAVSDDGKHQKVGREAVFDLLHVRRGAFQVLPLPKNAPRSIHEAWSHLVMDAMRVFDERALSQETDAVEPKPDNNTAPTHSRSEDLGASREAEPDWADAKFGKDETPFDNASKEVARLIDEGNEAVRSRDFWHARALWEQALALDPANRTIQLNLRKLDRIEQTT
ncbi:MAG: response regulator [Deltaproteobacteria bacterium]|nr:response regulator [Deltaproteobacteria bacterium]